MGIGGGQSYTFNGGMELVVSGTAVAPQNASVDGREMNTQAVLIDGVAMQRLILVTDAEMTITVVTRTNSGADGNLQFPATSRGDTTLNAADAVFMTLDGAVNSNTRTMVAFGTFSALDIRSDALSIGSTSNDTSLVTQTITPAPGATRSLLQFAAQSANNADGCADLNPFT